MFAFSLKERDSGRVLLCQDRLGIKPLYYAPISKSVRFASNLPALLACGDIDTGIDTRPPHHYMTFHYTILKGVRKLPPATLISIDPNGRTQQQV